MEVAGLGYPCRAFWEADPCRQGTISKTESRQFQPLQPARVARVGFVNLRPHPLSCLAALALALGLAGGLVPAPALAQTGTPVSLLAPQQLAQALELASQSAQALAPAKARIVVTPGQLDPRLKLAPCTDIQAFMPAGVPAWGRSRVGLRCAKGQVGWQVYLPIQVEVWAWAPVLVRALPAGAQLDESMFTPAEVNWAASTTSPHQHASTLLGRVLVRPVAAGHALWAADLKSRQWFGQGDTVRIVAQGSGFAISTEGTAMGAGLEGQLVRVKTESGRIISAWPVGARQVELSL